MSLPPMRILKNPEEVASTSGLPGSGPHSRATVLAGPCHLLSHWEHEGSPHWLLCSRDAQAPVSALWGEPGLRPQFPHLWSGDRALTGGSISTVPAQSRP